MTSNEREIRDEIERQIRRAAEVRQAADRVADEAVVYAKSIAPVDTGDYAASIGKRKLPPVNGMPRRRVIATDFKAHWIEYGTGEPYPTEEAAVFQKTARHFGGTMGDGDD